MFLLFVACLEIHVFPVCYMLCRYEHFLFVTCCTDVDVSCLYMLYRYGCFLFVTRCTDQSVPDLFFIVQILVFPVCSLLYKSEYLE